MDRNAPSNSAMVVNEGMRTLPNLNVLKDVMVYSNDKLAYLSGVIVCGHIFVPLIVYLNNVFHSDVVIHRTEC